MILDRLDKIITENNLEPIKRESIKKEPKNTIYDNLSDVINDDIEFDEFDTKVVIVKNIGFNEIKLPQKLHGVIVDDIQKSVDGNYIVNLTRA